MFRCSIILIAFLAVKDYKLCNAAILPEEMPLAAFEEKDEETLVDIQGVKAVADSPTVNSISLTSLISDKKALNYLSTDERLKRAIAAAKKIGCQPSVLIAQDGIESGWGESDLVKKTKNSGNIKCRCNTKKALRKKHAYLASIGSEVCVQGYDRIEKSNDYYIKFKTQQDAWNEKVKRLASYKVVKRAPKGLTAEQWCDVLCKSPYATDKNYGKTLKRVLNEKGLKKIDEVVSKGMSITSESGKYTFYGPDVPHSPINWVTFPDQDDKFESFEHRKAKREKWAEYISKNKAHALRAQEKYNTPASVLLAEGLILSNCGQNEDHFQVGIKFGSVRDAYMSHARAIKAKSYIDYAQHSIIGNKLIHVIEDMELYNYDKK